MYFEFRLSDLYELKEELNDILSVVYDLDECITYYNELTPEEMQGKFSDEIVYTLTNKHQTLTEIIDYMEVFEEKIDEIIEIIEDSDVVHIEHNRFIYEPEVYSEKLKNITELLDIDSAEIKNLLNLSDSYRSWENSITSKLDNSKADITDAIEELKQIDDEKVFRHNRAIMQSIESEINQIIGLKFINSLNNIDEIKNTLNQLLLLDDITNVGDILLNTAHFGNTAIIKSDINNIGLSKDYLNEELRNMQKKANQKKNLDSIISESEIKQMKEELLKGIPDEVLDMADHFKNGETLVIDFALISDDMLQQINSTGFFTYTIDNNQYKFDMKYKSITEWAQDNTKILDNITEKAMKSGISGIYKLDPKTKKWYTYDSEGNVKMYTILPDELGAGLTKFSKILLPLGIAIDTGMLYDSWKTGDVSEFLETAGGIVGGATGGYIAVAFFTDGLSIPVSIIISILGGLIGSTYFSSVGRSIGDEIKSKNISWEKNEEV